MSAWKSASLNDFTLECYGQVEEPNLSLHFHSLKRRLLFGMPEVVESVAPVFTAVDAVVVYFQSTVIFPSWTSRVRPPSPAPSFQ
jgi:hypothetical protein